MKNTPRKIMIVKLDKLFSTYMRAKNEYRCEYCDNGGRTENHHGVVHRRYMNTRYNEENCVCLCSGCHRLFSDFPRINNDFFIKRNGSDSLEEIEILARSGKKVTLEELEALYEKYSKLLKRIQ